MKDYTTEIMILTQARRETCAKNQYESNDQNVGQNYVGQSSAEYETPELYSLCVDVIETQLPANDLWKIAFNVGKHTVQMKIDTGAQCNIISKAECSKLTDIRKLLPSKNVLTAFSGEKMTSLGIAELKVNYKGQDFILKCGVVDRNVSNIIGQADGMRLHIVKRVYSVTNDDIISDNPEEILAAANDVFDKIGCVPGIRVHMKLRPNIPSSVHPARSVPVPVRDGLKQELERLVKLKILTPVKQPTAWVSSMLVVNKPNKTRIVIDPRDLNKALCREYYPMNTLENVITRTHGSKYFTVLDANSGYYQLQLDEESSILATMNTPFGKFRYLRLPMGISNAPEIFQTVLTEIFGGIEGCEIIMDDILIHGRTIQEHNSRLNAVLNRARENNLCFNSKKTKLARSEVDYHGHVITGEGLKVSREKVKAILDMPVPNDKQAVQRLIGLVTYLSKFVENFSDVIQPLRECVKLKNRSFHFDEPQKECFAKIKEVLTTAPVLKFYSMSKPITVLCDSSKTGLGAVILQGGRPVAYASRTLTDTEQAYAQIEKEMLAIVFACSKFHKLLFGRKDATLETDHLPLLRIFEKTLHLVPMRLQKMLLKVQPYTFKLVGKPGKEMYIADTLSRAHPQSVIHTRDDIDEFLVTAVDVNID